MRAVKVDERGAIHLDVFQPGDCYEAEFIGADEIKLRRVLPLPTRRLSRSEVIQAIEGSPLRFALSWDDLKQETRT